MPYFLRWTNGTNKAGQPVQKMISLQTLNEEEIKKHLIDNGFHKFNVEYFEYTEPPINIVVEEEKS